MLSDLSLTSRLAGLRREGDNLSLTSRLAGLRREGDNFDDNVSLTDLTYGDLPTPYNPHLPTPIIVRNPQPVAHPRQLAPPTSSLPQYTFLENTQLATPSSRMRISFPQQQAVPSFLYHNQPPTTFPALRNNTQLSSSFMDSILASPIPYPNTQSPLPVAFQQPVQHANVFPFVPGTKFARKIAKKSSPLVNVPGVSTPNLNNTASLNNYINQHVDQLRFSQFLNTTNSASFYPLTSSPNPALSIPISDPSVSRNKFKTQEDEYNLGQRILEDRRTWAIGKLNQVNNDQEFKAPPSLEAHIIDLYNTQDKIEKDTKDFFCDTIWPQREIAMKRAVYIHKYIKENSAHSPWKYFKLAGLGTYYSTCNRYFVIACNIKRLNQYSLQEYGSLEFVQQFNIGQLEKASRDDSDNTFKIIAATYHKPEQIIPINVPTTEERHEENLKVKAMSAEFNLMVNKMFEDWVLKKKVPVKRFKKMMSAKNKTIKDDGKNKRSAAASGHSRKRPRRSNI